jgi:hypothetical protein
MILLVIVVLMVYVKDLFWPMVINDIQGINQDVLKSLSIKLGYLLILPSIYVVTVHLHFLLNY